VSIRSTTAATAGWPQTGNAIHLVGKGWVADQGEDEIALVLPTFTLRYGEDLVRVEGGEDGGYRGFWNPF